MIYKLHFIIVILCILGIVIFTIRSIYPIALYEKKAREYNSGLMTKTEALRFMVNSEKYAETAALLFWKNIIPAILSGIVLWIIW